MTIDTTLPASDPLRFRKKLLSRYKMTVTDQLKIIENQIKASQAQYHLGRLAAKISAYSSGDLRKYKYLTGEDLGYKPSVFKQAEFDYSPLGNIFNEGLDKDDQKEGLFKRVENIKGKNEKLLKAFTTASRVSKAAKNESDFNYNSKYAFYRDLEKHKRMVSIDSKHGKLKEFYKLLGDFKNHKPITNGTKNRKNRILNNVNQLYNKYFDTLKHYDGKDLNERDEEFFDPKQFKILGKKKQISVLTEENTEKEMRKSESTKENSERELPRLLWFEINKKEFEELTRDIYSNQ